MSTFIPTRTSTGKATQPSHLDHGKSVARSRFEALNMEDWEENIQDVLVEMEELGDQLKSIISPTSHITFTGPTHTSGKHSSGPTKAGVQTQ